jgi:hypothetical protein
MSRGGFYRKGFLRELRDRSHGFQFRMIVILQNGNG